MRITYPLCALILASAGARLLSAGTMINESISCQSIQLSTGAVVATDSHSTTIDTASVNVMAPVLPGCSTPFGSMMNVPPPFTPLLQSAIQPPPTYVFLAAILTNDNLQSAFGYGLSALIDIHLTQQQTFIATGGTGIGIMHGLQGSENDSSGSFGPLTGPILITTSFGTSDCCPVDEPVPFTYQFVFGQPFTLSVTADYVINPVFNALAPPPGSNEGSAGAEVGYNAIETGITDANGNPISATFTVVPEPSTFALLAAALVMVAVSAARKYAAH